MFRCEFRHDAFTVKNAHRGDQTDQCWLVEVGNFGTTDLPEYLCILHAPPDREPIDRDDWKTIKRAEMQATHLKTLLNEWYKTAPIGTPFALPGLHCGDIDRSSSFSPAISSVRTQPSMDVHYLPDPHSSAMRNSTQSVFAAMRYLWSRTSLGKPRLRTPTSELRLRLI